MKEPKRFTLAMFAAFAMLASGCATGHFVRPDGTSFDGQVIAYPGFLRTVPAKSAPTVAPQSGVHKMVR